MIHNTKCSKCGQPATHKFTRIEAGQIRDLFLCANHAAELSPYQKQSNLSEILEGLLNHDLKINVTPLSNAPAGLCCKTCGLTYEAYRKNFMLGCGDCYVSFRELLIQDLRKFHGGVRHRGRRPGGGKVTIPEEEAAMQAQRGEETQTTGATLAHQKQLAAIEELQRKLDLAIQTEDFEKAARYRDQIKELKLKVQAAGA